MSKNFVREIDSIKNINKQEYYTNKPNDLLSTKEHNYIRKETEEYHCLTDNVKQTKVTNVRYTDTTAKPNVNYNLISFDNSQVPKTNQNTISATGLVNALTEKDQQIQKLENELATLNKKQPLLQCVSEFAGNQFFNMQTVQTYNFDNIDIYVRVVYRMAGKMGSYTKNFDHVLEYGATNFEFDEYNITIANYFEIGEYGGIDVAIDSEGTGLNFTVGLGVDGYASGEVFIKFKLVKKQQLDAE